MTALSSWQTIFEKSLTNLYSADSDVCIEMARVLARLHAKAEARFALFEICSSSTKKQKFKLELEKAKAEHAEEMEAWVAKCRQLTGQGKALQVGLAQAQESEAAKDAVLDALRRDKEAETARSESLALVCEQQTARDALNESASLHNSLLEAEHHLEDANARRAELAALLQADAETNRRLAAAEKDVEALRQTCERLKRDIETRNAQAKPVVARAAPTNVP
jgi:hypothetical protein